MSVVSISLPSDLQLWVDARVSAGAYADPADFMRDLLRRDHADYIAQVDRVGGLVDEGLASGTIDAEPEEILHRIIAGIPDTHG